MSTNLSKRRRDEMIETIKKIKEKIHDDNILRNLSEIEYELTKKKYGLIWEEHEERVDEELKTQIPTFEEVKNKEIICNKNDSFNFLLEGDNLHSLYLLEKTHKEKIDVIYIDPPYNTGNKDFIYDDKMVDNKDSFKHSKWLSFMNRRLEIAKKLLIQDGIIIIHIDENEISQLKILCDDIFGDMNFVGEFIWKARSGKSGTNSLIATEHEHILVYAKEILNINFYMQINKSNKVKTEQLRQWGQNVYREDRPTMFFPILEKNGSFSLPTDEEIKKIYIGNKKFDDIFLTKLIEKYKTKQYNVILPMIDNSYGRWRKGLEGIKQLIKDNLLVLVKNDKEFSVKKMIPNGSITKTAISSIIDNLGTASTGTVELKDIFNGKKVFNTTKPLTIAKYLINLGVYNKTDAIILDFFAGSGTTAQAVLELNKEDNGNRKFILCTNNENSICEDITYERIKTVITGKRKDNTEYSEEINANLKYYRTTYIPKINTEQENIHENLLFNIKNLIQLENGINVDDKKVKVILKEEKIDQFSENKEDVKACEKLYISSDVLLTAKQNTILKNNEVEVYIIPEYYFDRELREEQ